MSEESNALIIVVGGDGRRGLAVPDARVRHFQGASYGGNGATRSAVTAIRNGAVDLVLLLARWLGHSECEALLDACRAAGVSWHLVSGGLSAARRDALAFMVTWGG